MDTNSRIKLVFFFVFLVFIVFLYRVVVLVFFPDSKLRSFANNYKKVISLSGRRGDIYDRNGASLAVSVKVKSLYLDPFLFLKSGYKKGDLKKIIKLLSLPHLKAKNILHSLHKKKRFVWVKRHLNEDQYNKVKLYIKQHKLKGLYFVDESKRVYPNGRLLSHVLGFVNIDSKGLSGVERFYDDYLYPKKERYRIKFYKDAKGRLLYRRGKIFKTSFNSNSLYLTIDLNIQYQIEAIARYSLDYFKAKSITIIVADPYTGAIVSLVNMPDFDPNHPSSYPVYFRKNRAIADIFEPGSIFKIITMALALKKGVIDVDEKIWCENGRMEVGDRIIKEAEGHAFGYLSPKEIIEKSSNIGTLKIAFRIGKKDFFDGIKIFGFGKYTGIDLPGEVRGIVRYPNNDVLFATMSFGQGIAVTPIQVIKAYSIIANGGYDVTPYVVEKVKTAKGKILFTIPPKEKLSLDRVISKKITDILKDMLRWVVLKGTGIKTNIRGFSISGKTGTAQKPDTVHGGYYKDKYILSFAGFFPTKKPKYVILVMVDEPKKGRYASSVAVPIFRRVVGVLIQSSSTPDGVAFFNKSINLDVDKKSKNYRNILAKTPKATGVFIFKDSKTFSGVKNYVMPNYKGMSLREFLIKNDYPWDDIFVYGFGYIYKTDPPAGSIVKSKILKIWLKI